MEGLSICTGDEPGGRRVKCAFRELVDPIRDLISDLHWILDGVVVSNQVTSGPVEAPELDPEFAAFLVAQSRSLSLMRPGFIERFAPFITGDWDQIVGVRSPADFADGVTLDTDRIEAVGQIYFACTDAAFWEVYSPNDEIRARLLAAFPSSIRVSLDDKQY
jgi:hypothetical protein